MQAGDGSESIPCTSDAWSSESSDHPQTDHLVLVMVKSLSSLNIGVCGEKKMVYKLQQTGDEEETMLMGGRSYVDVKTVYDVMDSVLTGWQSVIRSSLTAMRLSGR